MCDDVSVIIENGDGSEEQLDCRRLAILWQGRELWIQAGDNGQLMIGVEDGPDDLEYADLLLRPLASNLVSLQLEFEPRGEEQEHGPDCDHEH